MASGRLVDVVLVVGGSLVVVELVVVEVAVSAVVVEVVGTGAVVLVVVVVDVIPGAPSSRRSSGPCDVSREK